MAAIPGRAGMDGLAVIPRRSVHDPLAVILAAAAVGTAVTVAAGGLTLLMRRLGGGFAVPPSAALSWAVAATGLVLVAAVDAAAAWGVRPWVRVLVRSGLVVASLAVVPAFGSLGWLGRAAVRAALGLVAATALVPRILPGRSRGRHRTPRQPHPIPLPAAEPEAVSEATVWQLQTPVSEAAALPAGLRQRLERTESEIGEDCLQGQLVLSFTTGSRTAHAHVGFCPSFAATPAVNVTTDYDGVEAELLVAEVLPWGMRVECRLAEPAEEPLEIPVDFQAHHSTRPAP